VNSCPACTGGWPRGDHRVADLGACVVYLHDDQFFRGWTVLVLKRHATELFELAAADRARLVDEVAAVAAALTRVHGAVKINYALLGNQLPHIHWHVIPRLGDDPAPRESVWSVPHEPCPLGPAELRASIAALRAALGP
jgi:diadenosine tetraphosphate (Ap4A) HIT family hydrolase